MRTLLLGLALMIALPGAGPARAATATDGFQVPDSARLVSLSAQLRQQSRALVETDQGNLYMIKPSATPRGLEYRSICVRRGFSYQNVDAGERDAPKIGWEQVGAIKTRGNGGATGALIGALVGLVAGMVVAGSQTVDPGFIAVEPHWEELYLPIVVGPLAGAAVGGIIGDQLDPWRSIYP
jgi:outer membrane lipoprotein SlyB